MPFTLKVRTVLASVLLLVGAPILLGPGTSGHRQLELEGTTARVEFPHILAWLASTEAQAAEPIHLSNIKIDADNVSIEIPQAKVEGSNLTQPQLEALFKNGATEVERFEDFSAALVTIPELVLTISAKHSVLSIRYRDLEWHEVKNGVISRWTASHSSSAGIEKDKDGQAVEETTLSETTGPIDVENLDIAVNWQILSGMGKPAAGEHPTRRANGPYTIKDYHLKQQINQESGKDPLTIDVAVANISGGSVFARPSRTSVSEILSVLNTEPDEFNELPADKKRALLAGFSNFLSLFDIEETTASNVTIRSTGPNDGVDYTVSLESIVFRYVDQQLDLSFSDISAASRMKGDAAKAQPDTVSIERIALEGMSFKPTIAALEEMAQSELNNDEQSIFDPAKFAPSGGRLKVRDLAVDFDMSKKPGDQPDRFTLSVKAFDTTTGNHLVDGRAFFETELTELHFSLPEADTAGLRELRNLGYEELTVSSIFRGNWNEETRNLTIDTLSLSGVDIGNVAGSAQFGDVGRDAYSGDISLLLTALEKSSLHELTVTLEDGGLFDRFVKQQSAAGAGSAADVKQQYGALAMIGIPALIGDTPTARKLASAVSRFANTSGRLTVTAKAKDPQGVPLKGLDLGASPAKLLEKFDVTTSD